MTLEAVRSAIQAPQAPKSHRKDISYKVALWAFYTWDTLLSVVHTSEYQLMIVLPGKGRTVLPILN